MAAAPLTLMNVPLGDLKPYSTCEFLACAQIV